MADKGDKKNQTEGDETKDEEDADEAEVEEVEDEVHRELRLLGITVDDEQGAVDDTGDSAPSQLHYASRDDVLHGSIARLPPPHHHTVSVYIISTATDFALEKNNIQREAVPQLRKYCYEHGLELRMLDPRWSVREDVESDHLALDICLQQLIAAKRSSTGPYCVLLLGERYGTRPWPSQIEESEFTILYDLGKKEGFDVLVLDDWFQRDENITPASYILQPVTSRFPFYNDETEANKLRRKKDMEDWANINVNIAKILQTAVVKAFENETISYQQKLKYFRSVIEKEVVEAFSRPQEAKNRVCLLSRIFRELSYTDKAAKRYVDISNNALDEEAYNKICHIRSVLVPMVIPEQNVKSFSIGWDSHGITYNLEEHESYINKFTSEFGKQIEELVSYNIKNKAVEPDTDALYQEVSQHGALAAEHADNFIVKADLIEEIFRRLSKVYIEESLHDDNEQLVAEHVPVEYDENNESIEKEIVNGDGKDSNDESANISESNENDSSLNTPVESPRDGQSGDSLAPSDGQEIAEVQNANLETAGEVLEQNDHGINYDIRQTETINESGYLDKNMNDVKLETGEDQAADSDDSEKDDFKTKEIKKDEQINKKVMIMAPNDSIRDTEIKDQATKKKLKTKKKPGTPKTKRKFKKKKAIKKVPCDGFDNDSKGNSNKEDEYRILTEDEMMTHKRTDLPEVSQQDEYDQHQALLNEIQPFILRSYHMPLIVTGALGTGKSTVLAKMIQDIELWTKKPVVKVIRHLGGTSRSQSIRNVLVTICQQIWEIYDIDKSKDLHIENEFTILCQYFNVLLHKLPAKERPILIAIDGVENLDDTDDPQAMTWLPVKLPIGVYFVVSIGTVLERTCIYTLQQIIKDNERYLEVGDEIPDIMANELIEKWMENKNIKLNGMQQQYLLSKIKANKTMLFTKIALLQATTWKSYYTKADLVVSNTVKETFERIITDLEKTFGRIVPFKVLGYLTIARNGLTEQELEDILSCDDECLLDAYLYYNPADEQTVRFPQLLWLRLRNELSVYIRFQAVEGRQVMTWVHDQISEVIREKYLTPEITYRFHGAIADYYEGKWAGVVKPLNLPRRRGVYSQVQRRVPAQPLSYAPGVYNLRKLRHWSHHLVHSYRFPMLVQETCFNFEWLWNKCQATSIGELLHDLKYALERLHIAAKGLPTYVKNDLAGLTEDGQDAAAAATPRIDFSLSVKKAPPPEEQDDTPPFDQEVKDIELLRDILQLTQHTIKRQPSRLAVQLLAQLAPTGKDVPAGLQQLRKQISSWCQATSLPSLVPQSVCMPFPGSPLRNQLMLSIVSKGDIHLRENKLCLSNNTKVLYAIDHQRTGDYLVQYDVSQDLKVISVTLLPHSDVKRINIAGRDAALGKEMYFKFEKYKHRDKYTPEVQHELRTMEMEMVSTVPVDCELLAISNSGTYAAVKIPLTPEEVQASETLWQVRLGSEDVQTGKSVGGQLPLMTLINTLTGSKLNLFLGKPVEVQYTIFSPDEKYLVVFCKNGVYSFGVETAKVRHRWEEIQKSGVYSQNNVDRLRRCVVITKTSQLIMPGIEANNTTTIYRRDLKTGETMYEMKGSRYPVDIITTNEENNIAAAATCYPGVKNFKDEDDDPLDTLSRDKMAVVWDLEWGKQLSRIGKGLGSKEGTVLSIMAFCGLGDDYLLTNCVDGQPSITMWYIGSRSDPCSPAIPVHELNAHSSPVHHIFVADRGQRLVSASLDNTIAVWELAKVYDLCDKVIGTARSSPEDLELLRKQKNKDVETPYGPGNGMIVSTSMAVSRNGQIGAVGTHDGWVIFYDLSTMKMTRYEKVGKGQEVNFMMCTKSGRYFISACVELRVWIPDSGQCRHVFRVACRSHVDSLAESRDVLVAGYSGRECCAMVWDLHSGLRLRRLEGYYGFSKVAMTSDASKVVGTFFDFPMIFNVHSGEPENSAHMETNEYDCTCLKVSPDDNFVASASTDGSVKVMDMKTGAYRLWLIHSSPVHEAIFTPNSMKLLTAGFKNIFIWSTLDGTLLGKLQFHTARINQLNFVMQGRFLISCSDDKHIVVWDFQRRQPVTNFETHCPQHFVAVTHDMEALLFSPRQISYIGVLKPNPQLREALGPTAAEMPEPDVPRVDHHYDSDSW